MVSLLAARRGWRLPARCDAQLIREVPIFCKQIANAVARVSGAFHDLKLEYAAVSAQLSRHEEWFKKLAAKVGVTLES
jgi:hypothetical protein